jgi:hypothetical protein
VRPERKRPLGRLRYKWEDNIKMDFREIGINEANWIQLTQDKSPMVSFCENSNELLNSIKKIGYSLKC